MRCVAHSRERPDSTLRPPWRVTLVVQPTVAILMAKRTPRRKPRRSPPRPHRRRRRAYAALSLLRSMLLQRRFEERCAEAYAIGSIGGFCHLYIGQEAVAPASLSHAAPRRLHHHHLSRSRAGARARHHAARVMAELFGRIDGCARRQGRLDAHVRQGNSDFLGGHGIVGGHVPIATGVGFAIKYRGGDQVIVLLHGRSGREQRRVPRSAQHGRALEAAGALHHREQPLRHGHRRRARVGHQRHLRARRQLRHAARRGGRPGRARRARRRSTKPSTARARSRARRCSRCAPTASWATPCPTPSAARTARKAELEEYLKRDPIALLRPHMEAARRR